MWRSVRTWIFGVAKPRKSVPKCGVACRLGLLGVSKPRKFVPKRCAACGLGFLGSRNPGSSFQNVAQRADLVFWGLAARDEAPVTKPDLPGFEFVGVRWVSVPWARGPRKRNKHESGPWAHAQKKGRTNPGWNQKEKANACVCALWVAPGQRSHFGFHKLGEAPRRSRARGLPLPTGRGARVPGRWLAILGFTNGGSTTGSRARGLPLPTGCSSPRSLEGHLWFLKWGCNLRVASPWAAPPNGMGCSSPQSLKGNLWFHLIDK